MLDARVFGGGGLDSGDEVGMRGGEFQEGGIVQPLRAAAALVGAERGECVDKGRHGGLPFPDKCSG